MASSDVRVGSLTSACVWSVGRGFVLLGPDARCCSPKCQKLRQRRALKWTPRPGPYDGPDVQDNAPETRSMPGALKSPRAALFTWQTLSGDRHREVIVPAGENRREARERLARNVGAQRVTPAWFGSNEAA
jgi:hypothetical protein